MLARFRALIFCCALGAAYGAAIGGGLGLVLTLPVYGLGFIIGLILGALGGLIGGLIGWIVRGAYGWGLGGLCPGPGLVSAAAGTSTGFAFVIAMLVGMLAQHALVRRSR